MESGRSGRYAETLVFAAVLAGHMLWGFGSLLTKVALRHASPVIVLSARFLIANAALLGWGIIRGERLHLRNKPLMQLLALGAFEPFCLLFESYGILYSNASFAGIMISLTPLFSILLAVLLIREYPTKAQLLFCIFPIAGAILITSAGHSLGIVHPLGVLFLLLHCLFSGAFKTINRGASDAFSPFERTFIILAVCMVVFTAAALVSVKGNLHAYVRPFQNRDFVICVVLLGIFCSFVSNMAVNYAAGRISVAQLSIFSTVTTLCAAIGGVVFLHEPVSLLSVIGSVMIIFGTWQVARRNS